MTNQELLFASIVGTIIFYSLMMLWYRNTIKKIEKYNNSTHSRWANEQGPRTINFIKWISVVYGILMTIQIIGLI